MSQTLKDKIDRVRELNRIRAAKFYAANNLHISEARKIRRDLTKAGSDLGQLERNQTKHAKDEKLAVVEISNAVDAVEHEAVVHEQRVQTRATEVETRAQQIAARAAAVEVREQQSAHNTPTAIHGPVTNLDLVTLIDRLTDKSDATRTTYKSYLRALPGKFLNGGSIYEAMQDGQALANAITSGTDSTSTKRGYLQVLLVLVDKVGLVISETQMKPIRTAYGVKSIETVQHAQQKAIEIEVPSWDEYLGKVREHYGANTKMDLVARLYKEAPVRDDFQLKFVNIIPDGPQNENFIVDNGTGPMTVYINKYKTAGLYGEKRFMISVELSTDLRAYHAKHKGEYLFGALSLSPLVSAANKKLGYQGGGINLLRKMTASTAATQGLAAVVENANRMGHSARTEIETYTHRIRKQKTI